MMLLATEAATLCAADIVLIASVALRARAVTRKSQQPPDQALPLYAHHMRRHPAGPHSTGQTPGGTPHGHG